VEPWPQSLPVLAGFYFLCWQAIALPHLTFCQGLALHNVKHSLQNGGLMYDIVYIISGHIIPNRVWVCFL
jgi:hypothetical protein